MLVERENKAEFALVVVWSISDGRSLRKLWNDFDQTRTKKKNK